MQVKIYLEKGETEKQIDELLEKAFHHKHEKTHTEEFQDPLIEALLSELDAEVKRTIMLGGFEETMTHILDHIPYADQ